MSNLYFSALVLYPRSRWTITHIPALQMLAKQFSLVCLFFRLNIPSSPAPHSAGLLGMGRMTAKRAVLPQPSSCACQSVGGSSMFACPGKVINFLSGKGQSHVSHLPASEEDSLRLTGWGGGRDPRTGEKDTAGRPQWFAGNCLIMGSPKKEEAALICSVC